MMKISRPLLVLLPILAAAGCSDYAAPAPVPTSIVPDHAVRLAPQRAAPLDVIIRGDDLAAGVEVNLHTGEVRFDGAFEALLGETPLENVRPLVEDDNLSLQALVPADLEAGVFDLLVRAPDGGEGTLPGAFEMRTVAAVALVLDEPEPLAGERVVITATVRDNRDAQVHAAAADDINFTLDSGSGSLGAARLAGGAVQVDYQTAPGPEGAVVRATEQLSGDAREGTVLVDSRAGEIAGVRIEPEETTVTAGEPAELAAWLIDIRGNSVPAAVAEDIRFDLEQGNGILGDAAVREGRVVIGYTSSTTVETARVRAVEQVSGRQYTATSEIEGAAGEPRHLRLAADPASPLAGDPTTVSATLEDVHGNMIPMETADDVDFTLISGRGILSGASLFGGQCLASYSTYRKLETAIIQGELSNAGGIPPARVLITTVGGDPAGVIVIPAEAELGAGQEIDLAGWLADRYGNPTAASSPDDLSLALVSGPGSFTAGPALEAGAVRVRYAAPDALGQTAVVEAIEHVTGNEATARASVHIVAGPVDHFDVQLPGPSVPAGAQFNLEVIARDSFGHPAVSFDGFVFVSDTTGTISPAVTGRFAAGRRTVTASISEAAADVIIHVEDAAGHPGDSAAFDVVGGLVDRFSIDPVADQVAGAPFELTIRALDELGNPVEDYAASVLLADTTGTLQPQVSGNFSAGVRLEPVTITAAHPAVEIEVADGLGHTGRSNPFAVAAGAPAAIAYTSAVQNIPADTPSDEIRIEIRDAHNNPVAVQTDTPLSLETDSGGGRFDLDPAGAFDGSLTSLTVPAGSSGASFYYLDSVLGDAIMTVSDPSAVLAPAGQLIKISQAGDPSRLRITAAPGAVEAGQASTAFVVQLQDVASTPITSHPPVIVGLASTHPGGRFDTNAGGAFDGSVTSVTISNGSSDVLFYYRDTLAGAVDVSVATPGLVGHAVPLAVLAGPVGRFEIGPVAGQQAGRAFGLRMVAYDQFDNVAAGFEDSVSIDDNTGTLSPALSGLFSGGERVEQVTVFGATGADVITVSDGAGATGLSNSFVVEPGPVDHFEIAQVPSPRQAGVAFTLSLTARDAWDNQATGFTGVVTLDDTTATLDPSQSGAFTGGQRDETVSIIRADPAVTVTADDEAGHTGQSNPFEVLPGELDHFAVGPLPASVGADTDFPLPIEARDAWENPVPSFTSTVDLADLTGTLTPQVSGAFSAGAVTEQARIAQAANDDVITVSDGDGHTGQSDPFDVIEAQPVDLVATLELEPRAVVEGEGFAMWLRVANTGDADAVDVEPVEVTFAGDGGATVLDGPQPALADIPGRTDVSFVWNLATGPGDSGWLEVDARARGTDTSGGNTVESNLAHGAMPITAAACVLNPVVADAGPDQSITCGDATTLGGDPAASGGLSPHTFAWEPADDLDDPAAPAPRAAPDRDTTYRLLALDQIGCGDRDDVTVAIVNGPTAGFDLNRERACEDDWFQAEAYGSSGAGPLDFWWDWGDGSTDTGFEAWHRYDQSGVFEVTLSVTDANGCSAVASRTVGANQGGDDPTGPVHFAQTPTAPADGSSQVDLDSDTLRTCWGAPVDWGHRFNVVATRGTVTTQDVDSNDGRQVRTDAQGRLTIRVRADRAGGAGRLLLELLDSTPTARGVARYDFTGSTSLPRVADFGPSGSSDLPPPRFSVRFDKPMSTATLQAAFTVTGSLSGQIPGAVTYEPRHRRASFVPDTLLDPAGEVYTVAIASTASDAWGNPLDGDLDGLADGPSDAFSWSFGAVADATPPAVACAGAGPDPFTPDGDGKEDTSEIMAALTDETGLWLWRVEILDADGLPLATLAAPQSENAPDARLNWDGRDRTGLLVDNGVYDFRVQAFDQAGNRSSACTGTVEVRSILNPADFP